MKIAITTTGDNLDSEIDPRFGRAQFILLVGRYGSVIEVIDNAENRAAMGGAGIQAVRILADKKVDVLITGGCGPNAREALKGTGIDFVEAHSGTAREVLDRFNRGELVGELDGKSGTRTVERSTASRRSGRKVGDRGIGRRRGSYSSHWFG